MNSREEQGKFGGWWRYFVSCLWRWFHDIKTQQTVHFKWMPFIVYKLYFNKTDLQRDREVPWGPVDWKGSPSSTEKEGKEAKAEIVPGPSIDGERRGWVAAVYSSERFCKSSLHSSPQQRASFEYAHSCQSPWGQFKPEGGDSYGHILTCHVCYPGRRFARSNLRPLNSAHLQFGIPVTWSPWEPQHELTNVFLVASSLISSCAALIPGSSRSQRRWV